MSRIFTIVLIVTSVALIGHSSASIFYTDEASWLQAAGGNSAIPYTGTTTVTDVYTTVETNGLGYCCNVIDTNLITYHDVPLSEFIFYFSDVGDSYDVNCFSGPPGCTATGISETIIAFNQPIDGIASLDAVIASELGIILGTINGYDIPIPANGIPSFFGIAGISDLVFQTTCILCDYMPNDIELFDIIVATATPVHEPSAFACLSAGLLIFMVTSARFPSWPLGKTRLIDR